MHHLSNTSWPSWMPAAAGGCLDRFLSTSLLLRLVRGRGEGGGTTGLLEDPGSAGPSRTAGRCPTSDGVRVPLQRRRRRRCPPALRQQQDGLPPLPLPGCGRQNHPPPQVLDSHLPLFQRPVYLPHPHHQPFAISETQLASVPSQIYPMRLRISPWLWFRTFAPASAIIRANIFALWAARSQARPIWASRFEAPTIQEGGWPETALPPALAGNHLWRYYGKGLGTPGLISLAGSYPFPVPAMGKK